MDKKKFYDKTFLAMVPPPPRSFLRLPRSEQKEIHDYIFMKARIIYDLLLEDGEKELKRCKKQYSITLNIALISFFCCLLVLIFLDLFMGV